MESDKELEKYIKNLIKDLDSPDYEVRQKAASSLLDESFAWAFDDNHRPIYEARIKKFKKIAKKSAFELLIEKLFTEEYYSIKLNIVNNLSNLKDPRAVEPFMRCLKNKNESKELRQVCSGALMNLIEYSEKPLLGALKDDDAYVRRMATYALGEISKPEYYDYFIELLNNSDWNVRFKAVEALGKLGNKKALEPLIECFNDKSANVRRKSIEVTGLIEAGEKLLTQKELGEMYLKENKS